MKNINMEAVVCDCGVEIHAAWLPDKQGQMDLVTWFPEHRPEFTLYQVVDRCPDCRQRFTYQWFDRAQTRMTLIRQKLAA